MTAALARPRPLVLIADDDPDILELVAFRLERAGYEIVRASDGEDALRLATEREWCAGVHTAFIPNPIQLSTSLCNHGSHGLRPRPRARSGGP